MTGLREETNVSIHCIIEQVINPLIERINPGKHTLNPAFEHHRA